MQYCHCAKRQALIAEGLKVEAPQLSRLNIQHATTSCLKSKVSSCLKPLSSHAICMHIVSLMPHLVALVGWLVVQVPEVIS